MAWSHRITEIQDRPAQILIDDQFRAAAPVGELPRVAWFGVYCRRDPGSSFWHPEESQSLDAVEDSLIGLCGEHGRGFAVYVMRIATPGIREYYIYVGAAADLSQVLPILQGAYPDYRIEFEEATDPAWERYTSCLPKDESVS